MFARFSPCLARLPACAAARRGRAQTPQIATAFPSLSFLVLLLHTAAQCPVSTAKPVFSLRPPAQKCPLGASGQQQTIRPWPADAMLFESPSLSFPLQAPLMPPSPFLYLPISFRWHAPPSPHRQRHASARCSALLCCLQNNTNVSLLELIPLHPLKHCKPRKITQALEGGWPAAVWLPLRDWQDGERRRAAAVAGQRRRALPDGPVRCPAQHVSLCWRGPPAMECLAGRRPFSAAVALSSLRF